MARRRARRRAELPPEPDDWAVAADDEPHLTRVEGPTALAASLGRLARRPGWGERLGAARVEAAWGAIVGDGLAGHCEPVRLAGRVLVVRAESPAWATQLRYLTVQLMERADAVLGAGSVTRVEVVVGRLTGGPPGSPSGGSSGSPSGGAADGDIGHTGG